MKLDSNRLVGLALAVVTSMVTATQVAAQDDGRHWTIGVLGYSGETPYGFRENAGFPMIQYENDYFRIGVPSLDVKLPWVSSEQLSFGLTADFLGGEGGYEASDDPILTGMAERKSSVWAGATMDWRTDFVDLSFKALGDVGGKSKGSTVALEASRTFFVSDRIMVTPRLGAVWLDDKAVDYYYGVSAGEATGSRPAYSGSSTVNVVGGLRIGYQLADRHMLMLDLNATKLGSGITDSPIVTKETTTSVSLGYMFRF